MTNKHDDDDLWDGKARELEFLMGSQTRPRPCSSCPFLVENLDRVDGPQPAAFYTHKRLADVWYEPDIGLDNGATFMCHHSGTPLVGGANPNAKQPKRCPGALALQQREAARYAERGEGSALTLKGFRRVVYLMTNGRLPELWRIRKRHIVEWAHPTIADPAIGHPDLAPPAPGEFE